METKIERRKFSEKLAVLADAAKYDASCASSGTIKRDSQKGKQHNQGSKGIGSTSAGMGICHSYAPDGRCISLLKILLTNFCIYDCSYCINRVSSPVKRARFSIDEVVKLTIGFYKRNYIEGLFLSSGIIQSSDYTMEQLVMVAKKLRVEEDFRGYIHLKTIPEASTELLRQAGLYADRLSINIELPSNASLARYAPEKNPVTIHQSMRQLKEHIDESKESRRNRRRIGVNSSSRKQRKSGFIYSPAGQSTQMIIGADNSSDAKILTLSYNLYQRYQMRRVYYSAYSPIPNATRVLPAQAPPLVREHRLYQADWLLRFYGFDVSEITENHSDDGDQAGMLDLDIDPKLAWALRHRDWFPVDINRAAKEILLRVPGIGAIGANRILQARKFRRLRFDDLKKCGLSVKKVGPFVATLDHNPANRQLDQANLRHCLSSRRIRNNDQQLSLF